MYKQRFKRVPAGWMVERLLDLRRARVYSILINQFVFSKRSKSCFIISFCLTKILFKNNLDQTRYHKFINPNLLSIFPNGRQCYNFFHLHFLGNNVLMFSLSYSSLCIQSGKR
jgi:hypothetical protein